MREIKAPRAWYKPLGVMIPAVEVESINFEAKVIGVYLEIDGSGYHKLRLSDFELMWPIGLCDCEGITIFEKDLIEDECAKVIGEVEWVQEHCAYMAFSRNPSIYHKLESDGQMRDTKVIGNIYEHPHLLPNREEQ